MNNNQNPYQPPKKPTYKVPANFIEALKDASAGIAKNTARGLSHDLIGGVAGQAVDTLFGASAPQNPQPNEQQDPFNFEELLRQNEASHRRQLQHQEVQRTYESKQVEVYNQRQREVDQKIQAVRVELQKLAREVINLDTSTQTAIREEITDPGTYHLNFFEKLLSAIKFLRKKVVESRHWAAMHQERRAKSYYWQQANSKVSGTKFMLSSERSVVTQTG